METDKFRTSGLYNDSQQVSLFSEASRPAVRPTKAPVRWVAGGGGLSPAIRRPDREGDNVSPSSAKSKNNWTYISTPPYAFIQDLERETC